MLPPVELEALLFSQVLLDRVVGPLDEHRVHADALQDVGHRGAHAEGINGPPVAGICRHSSALTKELTVS